MSEKAWWETIKAEGGHLLDQVKRMIEEGNVRRIRIRQEGHIVAEFPLTIGVVGAVLAPVLAAIGTLVERTTRLTLLVKLNGLTADDARRAFARKLRGVPSVFRKSLTYDRGKEMSDHQQLAKQLKIDIYFCDPRSPWQRATCENTNGLLRQYFPRGMDLVPVTQRQLNFVERRLNNRPREGLDGASPYEAWDELYRGVASET